MRRLRRDDFSRRWCASTDWPGRSDLPGVHPRWREQRQSVASMPGVERLSVDLLLPVAEECVKLGIPCWRCFR
jgi:porphobilinogen synthase (EC 4.2.1.24)